MVQTEIKQSLGIKNFHFEYFPGEMPEARHQLPVSQVCFCLAVTKSN